jgi:hypothetical protein
MRDIMKAADLNGKFHLNIKSTCVVIKDDKQDQDVSLYFSELCDEIGRAHV